MLTAWAFWRWVLLLLVTAAGLLAVWFLGPLLMIGDVAPFADVVTCLLTSAIIVLIAALVALYWRLTAKSRAREGQEPPQAPPVPDTPQAKAQSAAMARGFRQTLGVLRRIRKPGFLSRRYRYDLPWYAVVGADRAGKSALIQSSGLRFPLNEPRKGEISAGPLSFSFSEPAVLVETRGPLAPSGEDSGWNLFATLLKRHRPHLPINGILLVLSLPELLQSSDQERFSRHSDLREQLEQFQDILTVRVPIYLVLTKADRILGFEEFCADLSPAERLSVFGVTLPLYDETAAGAGDKSLVTTFGTQFDHFLQWQMPRMLKQVGRSYRAAERFDCFMVLPHLAMLKPLIGELIEDVFKPSNYERPLLLRGVYLTSAEAAAAGAEAQPPAPAGQGHEPDAHKPGLFIHDLLEKVVFPESGLVESDPTILRRGRILLWGLAAAAAIATIALTAWWTLSFIGNTNLISDLNRATARAKGTIALLDANPVLQPTGDTDLAAVLPVLNALKGLPTGWAQRNDKVPPIMDGGLSQTDYLARATRREYMEGLDYLLLPRLEAALERDITHNMGSPDALYPALKVYLMLKRSGPMELDAVMDWMKQLLARTYPGPAQSPLRAGLVEHISNLVESSLPQGEPDSALVSKARAMLDDYPAANRGMALLQQRPDIRALPPWRLTDVTGPLAPYSLTRRSGRPLSEPIDGMYTSEAFFSVMLPNIDAVARQLVSEDWVRFPTSPTTPPATRIAQLAQDITDLYVNDYIAAWQNLISDVTIAGFDSLQTELYVLQSVIGPPSPLVSYLKAVTHETALDRPARPAEDAKAQGESAAPPIGARARALAQSVSTHFTDLHRFLAGNPSPLDEVWKSLGQLRATIGPIASSGVTDPAQVTELTSGPAFGQILNQLKLNTLNAPPALADSILALVRQTSSIANAGVRADLDSAWKSQVLPFCQVAINGKYPFAASSNDATIADFTRMFGPTGLMDKFFDKQLKPFVDTINSPWRLLANAGAHPDITPAALAYFEQAYRIRTMFFGDEAGPPQVNFTLTPVDLDPGALRVKLEIDGQALAYQYGPPQSVAIKWPGTAGGVRVEFGASTEGQPSSLTVAGPWALFRFLNARGLKRQSPTRFGFAVTLGPRSASFALDAGSVNNPFQKSPLAGFKCLPTLMP